VLNYFSVISCITNRDSDRFARLGAIPPKLQVNGNAKYDNIVLPFNEIEKYYRNKLDIKPSDTTFIAGSTHEGEEEQLISAYKAMREKVPGMIMIIAPRHIIRVSRIAALFEIHNLEYQLYSRLAGGNRRQDLILVDTIGELKNLYSIATYVFCGGSLVPKGGHNVMEPASWGKPVLYGPNMNDFKDAQYLLESAQIGFTVKNSQEICDKILYFHNNQNKYKETSTKAFKVIADQSGSAKRQARIIRDFL
jgi:3-deoxy-D-manno-octulosonic-acid transferase